MKTHDAYRILITPLSPVHVGTGESYEPTNYVIEDGVLHEFDTGSVMDALTADDHKALLDIVNRRPDTCMIQALQKFFYERRESLIASAVQRIPVLQGVADLYANRVGQPANREAGGRVVLNKLEIDRTSFNTVLRLPVLFGSSLKGAIRTALLDRVNNGRRAQEHKGLHEFQGRLFRYFDPEAKPRLSLELDPMRLVQLSDASWSGEPDLPATQVYLAVNRKKALVVDQQGKIRKSQAESKDLYQILECVSGMRYRAFTGQINLQSVDGIKEQDHQGRRRLPAASLRFDVKRIAQDCNAFYRPILQAENRLLSERGYLDEAWGKTIEKLLSSMKDELDAGKVFLLRIGRHSGAESVTLNGVRKIKIMRGKGQQPEDADSAKTFWLAANTKDQNEELLPFGWVLVEWMPLDTPVADRPELKEACETHLSAARSFAKKMAEQQARFAAAREQAEMKRREEEERRRRAEEDAARRAREEAERKARLAAMTEEERLIVAFREIYEAEKAKGRYQAGGIFDQKRNEFLRAASLWENKEMKRKAAELIRETISGWTGWPGKKKKQELKDQLNRLEN